MTIPYLSGWLSPFFFFNDTATTEIYTLSLHDALPISTSSARRSSSRPSTRGCRRRDCSRASHTGPSSRSEEHTSELQSQSNLVCRLLLEKKKNRTTAIAALVILLVAVAARVGSELIVL